MIQTIIFDFDGLMVESERVCFQTYKEMLAERGVDFQWETYINEFLGMSAVSTLEKMNRYYGCSFSPKEDADLFHRREMEILKEESVPLRPGLLELLDYLDGNGYRKVIATSASPDRLHMILERYDLDTRFNGITTAAEIQNGKPAPDIFLKACEKEGISAAEALVLEDSQAGIEAAYRAGIQVICIPCFKQPEEEYKARTTAVLPSLAEVPQVLEKL
ncbi:MAG: HAD family phosphatase [Eubacteriales bacterium]|nr:HAD family phosphatase [Eubacteriales bacterium]